MLSMHRITASRVHSGGDESCKTTANRPSLMTKSTTWCYTGATVGSKSLSFFKIAIAVICLSCAISTVHAKGGEGDSPHHDGELTYQNQWAVELHGCGEGGAGSCDAVANEIALKHGFVNRGQVGSLEKFYLFEHEHVHKRSLEHSGHMHAHLVKEPQVRWLEQQHIRKRVKRDSLTDKVFDFKDPQFKDQWYLNKGAEKGFDMNVMAAWQKGYTGAGVVVSILDDGIQTDHPDLVDNYDPKASTDINDKDDDPYPQDNGDNKHGTRCAGEVASMAGNDYCGVGVAYKSGIGGVRMLDGDVNDHVEASALSLNPQHIDIYSASWGPEDDGRTVDGPAKLATQAFISGAEKGRNGKGSIFVWASGNGGLHGDNCNCDGYTNSIYTLSISSSSQRNRKPWYLEECTSTLATTYSSGQEGTDKDIMTTDFKDKCTERHTGTSASAPLAAGLCALALEANPDITWRDMQYVVLMTANPTPLLEHGEFTETASGRKVSHMFGYGMMDAGAMVALAEQWTTVPEKHICKTKVDMTQHTIPAKGALVVHLDVDGCAKMADQHVRYLEHVQTHVTVEFHRRGDLNMRLISPMGTKSTLLGSRRRDSFSEFKDWPFLSVHYWSENPSGQWSLELTNVGDSFNHGTLKSWYIVFHGTAINPVRVKKDVQLTLTTLQGGGANRVDTSYNMENCHEECVGGCMGPYPDQCKECKHHIDTNGDCVSACPEGEYTQGLSLHCKRCDATCMTCSTGDECLTCQSGLTFVEDTQKCVQNCDVGYYIGQTTRGSVCKLCEEHCSACRSASQCTACKRGRILHNGECIANCPQLTYLDGGNTCLPCHSSCVTCSGGSERECLSCPDHYYSENGTCTLHCSPSFYEDDEQSTCLSCYPTCDRCEGPLDTQCTECREEYKLHEGKCQVPRGGPELKCGADMYVDNAGECGSCHSLCKTCVGPRETDCVTCFHGTFLDMSGSCVDACPAGQYPSSSGERVCLPCNNMCLLCSGGDDADCRSCRPGLHLDNGHCVASCPHGKYAAATGRCEPCHASCAGCLGSSDKDCSSCKPGMFLLDYACYGRCPDGYYAEEVDGQMTCVTCYHSCNTCSGDGPNKCLSCQSDFILREHICYEPCSDSEYFNRFKQMCARCHSNCATCSGPSESSCTSCSDGYGLDGSSSRCVPCCPHHDDPTMHGCCTCDHQHSCRLMAERRSETESLVPGMSTTSLMVIIIAGCISVVVLFFIIFIILQARSDESWFRGKSGAYSSVPLGCEIGIEKLALTQDDYVDEDTGSEAELFSQD